jgi:ankyrin repeat protein
MPDIGDEIVGPFLRLVGTGQHTDVQRALAASPALVDAVGPHPFWGGRPQALHVAIETRRRDMVDLLLAAGADVDGRNDQYDGWSPVMLAIKGSQTAICDELLRRGARVGLIEALMLGDDARVEALLHDGPQALPRQAPNAGSVLAFARTPAAIDRLRALGAPLDLVDRWGATPVDAFSRLGPRGAILIAHLAAAGLEIPPAAYARLGDRAPLERLGALDPSVLRQDAVLMGAVDFGHHTLVTWLLERGANPNAHAAAPSRHTALHSAAWNGDLAMATLLVAAGADRTLRDDEHHGTPRDWAETAIDVTNNPRCAAIVAYLAT